METAMVIFVAAGATALLIFVGIGLLVIAMDYRASVQAARRSREQDYPLFEVTTTSIELSKAAADILDERRRQIAEEGWLPEHDDQHVDGSLATAAMCYADINATAEPPQTWPWLPHHWKPTDRRRNLVKAAALLLAEIERIDRSNRA